MHVSAHVRTCTHMHAHTHTHTNTFTPAIFSMFKKYKVNNFMLVPVIAQYKTCILHALLFVVVFKLWGLSESIHTKIQYSRAPKCSFQYKLWTTSTHVHASPLSPQSTCWSGSDYLFCTSYSGIQGLHLSTFDFLMKSWGWGIMGADTLSSSLIWNHGVQTTLLTHSKGTRMFADSPHMETNRQIYIKKHSK